MKHCDYCGKEYSDEAVLCAVDRTILVDRSKPLGGEAIVASSSLLPNDRAVIFPEYRWSARDGWKFLGVIFALNVFWFFVTGAIARTVPFYRDWRWGPYGSVIMTCVFIAMNVLTAAYFARTETIASFCEATGLNRKPTRYVWFGVTFALGLRLVSHMIYALGWARSYSVYDVHAFRTAHGPVRYLFLFSLIAAAFWEEPVKRGFCYRAFRNSYSVPVSVGIILLYSAYAHWNQYAHFGWAVISLSAITVVQCHLREKSESIWDCILCHLVFNGSGLLVSGILRY